jgi:hypothetical protein
MSAAIAYERKNVANVGPSFAAGEEATLLAFARAGDSAAFESLVMPHRNALLRVSQRILRNREDAEDAAGGPLKPVFGLSGAVHLFPLAHSGRLLPERNLQRAQS